MKAQFLVDVWNWDLRSWGGCTYEWLNFSWWWCLIDVWTSHRSGSGSDDKSLIFSSCWCFMDVWTWCLPGYNGSVMNHWSLADVEVCNKRSTFNQRFTWSCITSVTNTKHQWFINIKKRSTSHQLLTCNCSCNKFGINIPSVIYQH